MERKDLEIVLSWRNRDEIRLNMINDSIIKIEEHLKWFNKIKEQKNLEFLIFSVNNVPVGIVNFYNMPDLDNGLMEKVYQFEVQDCLLEGNTPPEVITPIKDISVLLENADYTLKVP